MAEIEMNGEGQIVEVPDSLMQAIRADLRPVQPVGPRAVRILLPLVLSIVAAGVVIYLRGARSDLQTLPAALFWGQIALRLGLGVVLIAIAIRESVPSDGVAHPFRRLAMVMAVCGLVILPEWFARVLDAPTNRFHLAELACYRWELLASTVGFLVLSIIISRAWPLDSVTAFATTGLGVGMIADAALFASCEAHGAIHMFLSHSTAVITLGVLGAAIGLVVKWNHRRSS